MQDVFFVDIKDNVPIMLSQRYGAVVPPPEGWNTERGYLVVTDSEGFKEGNVFEFRRLEIDLMTTQ